MAKPTLKKLRMSPRVRLTDLPEEVLIGVGSYLEPGDLIRFSHANGVLFRTFGETTALWRQQFARLRMDLSPTLEEVAMQRKTRGSCFEKLVCILHYGTQKRLSSGKLKRRDEMPTIFVTVHNENIYNLHLVDDARFLTLTIWNSKTRKSIQIELKGVIENDKVKNFFIHGDFVCLHIDFDFLVGLKLDTRNQRSTFKWYKNGGGEGLVKVLADESKNVLYQFHKNGLAALLSVINFETGKVLRTFNIQRTVFDPRFFCMETIESGGNYLAFQCYDFGLTLGEQKVGVLDVENGESKILESQNIKIVYHLKTKQNEVLAIVNNYKIMVWNATTGSLLCQTEDLFNDSEIDVKVINWALDSNPFRFALMQQLEPESLGQLLGTYYKSDDDINCDMERLQVTPLPPSICGVKSFILHHVFVRVGDRPDGSINFFFNRFENPGKRSSKIVKCSDVAYEANHEFLLSPDMKVLSTSTAFALKVGEVMVILDFGAH